jgi:thiol-disulfide isomerase/thioredoxin
MTTGWVVAYASLWVAVVVVGVTLLGLLRRVNAVLAAAEQHSHLPSGSALGPALGTVVPEFVARTPDGGLERSATLRARGVTVYLFVSPGCGPCEAICNQLRASGWREHAPLVVVTSDSTEGRLLVSGIEPATVVLQRAREISDAFGVRPTPFAVTVDGDMQVVASRVPGSTADLLAVAHRFPREPDSSDLVH